MMDSLEALEPCPDCKDDELTRLIDQRLAQMSSFVYGARLSIINAPRLSVLKDDVSRQRTPVSTPIFMVVLIPILQFAHRPQLDLFIRGLKDQLGMWMDPLVCFESIDVLDGVMPQ